jgi:acyl-CoA thioesterase I
VHYYNTIGNATLCIFEGKHEMIVKSGLALLPVYNKQVLTKPTILCIGDSNGEIANGWVNQLRFELAFANIINKCKSGNTIGFNNGGNKSLNELLNINRHLEEANKQANNKPIEYVIISLGTNDAKVDFAQKQDSAILYMQQLIQVIKTNNLPAFSKSKIILLTPPPIAVDSALSNNNIAKYAGSWQRIQNMATQYIQNASKWNVQVINTQALLQTNWHNYTYDGIHYTPKGAGVVARAISESLYKKQ